MKGPEEIFQAEVIDLARRLGWWVYHTRISIQSTPGWPDLVLLRVNPDGSGQALFRELKSATGVVTPEQTGVLVMLQAAGLDAGVWRPADLESGVVSAALARKGARTR